MEREQHVIKEVKQCVVVTIMVTVMSSAMLCKKTPDTIRRQACNIFQSLNISIAVYVIVLLTATLLPYSVFSALHFTRLRVINFVLDKNYSTTSEEEEININRF
jgi:cytochrome bd-type quinol oxidase subunit 2